MNKKNLLTGILKRLADLASPSSAAAPTVTEDELEDMKEDPAMFAGMPLPEGPIDNPNEATPEGGIPVPGAHVDYVKDILSKKQAPLANAAKQRMKKYEVSGDIEDFSPQELAAIAARKSGTYR